MSTGQNARVPWAGGKQESAVKTEGVAQDEKWNTVISLLTKRLSQHSILQSETLLSVTKITTGTLKMFQYNMCGTLQEFNQAHWLI